MEFPENFRPASQKKRKNKTLGGNDKAYDPEQDPTVKKNFPIAAPWKCGGGVKGR